jgi:hypothetical protein
MWQEICKQETLILIIAVLLLCILTMATGKGIGSLLVPILKRIAGKSDVNINMGQMGEEMTRHSDKMESLMPHGESCHFDPAKCADHKAEYERSLRNAADITQLKQSFEVFKTKFFQKLDSIETGITDIKVHMARLHRD